MEKTHPNRNAEFPTLFPRITQGKEFAQFAAWVRASALTQGQKSMIAGRYLGPNGGGGKEYKINPEIRNAVELAEIFGVSRTQVSDGAGVLRHAPQEVIDKCERGHLSPATWNKNRRLDSQQLFGPGGSVSASRTAHIQLTSQLWQQLRQALTLLTGLPKPEDVMEAVRMHDKRGFLNDHLAPCIQFLGELQNECTKRREGGKAAGNGSHHAHTGDG